MREKDKAPAATAEAHTHGELGRPANTQSQYSTFSAACYWLSLGAELVPLYPNSKAIMRGFGVHGRRINDKSKAHEYFVTKGCNLGVLLSGLAGLICLDFDDPELFWQWRNSAGANARTRIERTKRGYHVYLATTLDWEGRSIVGLEVKQKGVVTVAPSKVGGTVYTLEGDTDCITSMLREYLAPPFFSLSIPHKPNQPAKHWARHYDLIARIKATYPIGQTLALYYPDVNPRGKGRFQHGRCPFHQDRRASFWIDNQLNTWGCMASSCPQHGTHDVINLIAIANSLTNGEALRMLARNLFEEAG